MELNDDVYRDIIGLCLVSPLDIPYVMASINEEDFPRGSYSTIFKTIKDLYNLGVDVDIVTVSNRLAQLNQLSAIGGRKEINELALNAPLSTKCRTLVDSVREQTNYRTVSQMVDAFKTKLESGDDVNSTCMDYCNKISNVVAGVKEDTTPAIGSSFDDVMADLLVAKDRGIIGLSTGYKSLDAFIGGFQKGKLYILGGRPSMGKSALAMNIAEEVSKDNNVLFVSLEMSRKEYAQRLMLQGSGIYSNDINQGNIPEEKIGYLQSKRDYLNSLNLFVETKSGCTVNDIELSIIRLKATRGSCDLVVVDYLQLLRPTSKNRSRENEVSEMSRNLKSLAIKYNVPLLVLSQLSRQVEMRDDKRPMMADLRESGAIEQDADVILFVYRGSYYYPDDPTLQGMADVLIRKNRGGTNNVDISMCFDGRNTKFTEAIAI